MAKPNPFGFADRWIPFGATDGRERKQSVGRQLGGLRCKKASENESQKPSYTTKDHGKWIALREKKKTFEGTKK